MFAYVKTVEESLAISFEWIWILLVLQPGLRETNDIVCEDFGDIINFVKICI